MEQDDLQNLFNQKVAQFSQKLEEKLSEYIEKFANPYIAAERGYVDDVIKPSETKLKIVNAFQLLKTKVDVNPKKKHCNIPL